MLPLFPSFRFARAGFCGVSRIMAVLALFTMAVGLRAEERVAFL
jgi:hypothetical protein